MKIRKLWRKFQGNAYFKHRKQPIQNNCVLFEAGQGKNMNGNMFAMVVAFYKDEKYKDYKAVFVTREDNGEEVAKRMTFYGCRAELVVRNSDMYRRYLATSKYLVNDNSFPPYFHKRKEQVYLNTWHGTPLKTLGKSDLHNAKSLANIQKNYLMCDYALFPNSFCEQVFMKDYMLENIYKGEIVMSDYPRNHVFLDEQGSAQLKKRLHLQDKKLIAYMPTWRGNNRQADAQIQKDILEKMFQEIDGQLQEDQLFYVNLHFLIGNTMDFTKYKHIVPFPSEYETYDFLAACDMLVTDYSSVFFDYAITQRKIILFAYDQEEYMRERGTYFPLEELPFPLVEDVDALMKEINKKVGHVKYNDFLMRYCAYAMKDTPARLLALLIDKNKEGLHVKKAVNNQQELLLIYGGKLNNPHINRLLHTYLQSLVKKNPEKNIVLSFRGKMTKRKETFLQELPKHVNYLAVVNRFEFPLKDKILSALSIRIPLVERKVGHRSRCVYKKERERLFYRIQPEKVVYYSCDASYMYKLFATFTCEKEAHIHHNNVVGVRARRLPFHTMCRYFKERYDRVVDHRFDDVHALWQGEEKENYYNKCLKIGNLFHYFSNNKKGMHISALCIAYTILPFSLKNLKIKIANNIYDVHIREGLHIGKGIRLTWFSLTLPYEDIKSVDIQNKVRWYFIDRNGYGINRGMNYSLRHMRKGKNRRGPIRIFEDLATSAYYRQTKNNVLYLTVRKQNASDQRKEQVKLTLAYILAKIVPLPTITILYEKEASRYEESASVLYEKLMDMGYKRCYFILDKTYAHMDRIDAKYKRNMICKTSFRHYFLFFKAKRFFGSEALVHAIDLRIANRYALKKLASKNIDYVFLQHGVMYMVSLDSEARKFFKPMKTKGKYRVVVSSKEEARHFIELGNYKPEYIYNSGLPKYDRNELYDDADKITIMLTWRPWEYNEARYDCTTTKYYQMLQKIVKSIPKKYSERIVVLPHPLFRDAIHGSDHALQAYFNKEDTYDDILKKTKVLITDYSSIAYDAFYRGSNVIFYWEEKEECMKNYGPSTTLMLNEENVFGDICYNVTSLKRVLTKNIEDSQLQTYIERYRKLVQFHDGKNTERLIAMMKKDGIL